MLEFFDAIWEYFTVIMWEGWGYFVQWVFQSLTLLMINAAHGFMNIVTEGLSNNGLFVNFLQLLDQHFVDLPNNVIAVLTLLRVQEAIMMVLSAYMLRLGFRMFRLLLPII